MATCMLVANFPTMDYQDTFEAYVLYTRLKVDSNEEWSSHIIKV